MMKRILRLYIFVCLLIPGAVPRAAFASKLKIGVFVLFHPRALAVAPGSGQAMRVEARGNSFLLEDGQIASCRIANGQVECRAGERILRAPIIRATGRGGADSDFTLSVPARIIRNYHGDLEILAQGGQLVPIVEMDLETAVVSAVAAESPPGAPLAALESQAVVTRSYYLAAGPRHRAFDFCDTTHCQFLREPPASGSLAAIATALTRGIVLHYRGAVVPTLFSASCGGRTRTLREVGLSSSGYPYYSVRCEACLRRAREWKIRLDRRQAAPLLTDEGSELARLELDRKLGWEAIPGDNYSLKMEGGSVLLTGHGAGHGVGLCQFGAAFIAHEGASFVQILAHYFPNTTLGDSQGPP